MLPFRPPDASVAGLWRWNFESGPAHVKMSCLLLPRSLPSKRRPYLELALELVVLLERTVQADFQGLHALVLLSVISLDAVKLLAQRRGARRLGLVLLFQRRQLLCGCCCLYNIKTSRQEGDKDKEKERQKDGDTDGKGVETTGLKREFHRHIEYPMNLFIFIFLFFLGGGCYFEGGRFELRGRG